MSDSKQTAIIAVRFLALYFIALAVANMFGPFPIIITLGQFYTVIPKLIVGILLWFLAPIISDKMVS